MHFKQIVTFKAQHEWLLKQPAQAKAPGFSRVPHRTTLMRRYRQLHQWLSPLWLSPLWLSPLLSFVAQWAKHGVVCVAPGLRLGHTNQGGADKRFVQQEQNQALLKARNRIEPLFDLLSNIGGISGKQKPLPVQGLDKVRSFLLNCVLLMQLTIILNRIWGLAPGNISHMRAVWT